MRNTPWTGECNAIVGTVENGKKYPYGCVKQTDYNDDIEVLSSRIDNVGVVAANANTTAQQCVSNINTISIKTDNAVSTANAAAQKTEQFETKLAVTTGKEAADYVELSTKIDNITARVNLISSGMNEMRNDVSGAKTDIALINSNLSLVKNDIQAVSTKLNSYIVSNDKAIADINARIDDITGAQKCEILTFTASPVNCELGKSENIVLTWTTSGSVATQTIDNVAVTGNTTTMSGVTASKTYTLRCAPANGTTVSKTAKVNFANLIYWGATSQATMSASVISECTHYAISDNKYRDFTVEFSNQYCVYAYPKRLGTCAFKVSGFVGGFQAPVTVSFTNRNGYTEDYYVYRSNQGTFNGTCTFTAQAE